MQRGSLRDEERHFEFPLQNLHNEDGTPALYYGCSRYVVLGYSSDPSLWTELFSTSNRSDGMQPWCEQTIYGMKTGFLSSLCGTSTMELGPQHLEMQKLLAVDKCRIPNTLMSNGPLFNPFFGQQRCSMQWVQKFSNIVNVIDDIAKIDDVEVIEGIHKLTHIDDVNDVDIVLHGNDDVDNVVNIDEIDNEF